MTSGLFCGVAGSFKVSTFLQDDATGFFFFYRSVWQISPLFNVKFQNQEKTIIDLRKTLLAMRRAVVLTTSEYEKKNRELEEALRFDERSSSPSAPEKRELQMDDIENSTSNAT
ncbi:hypothetical protein RhiirA5_398495 [Rhizophagus irregularis]|uniref:Uncharacterized protein n=1 Tax=Rhizophagus irregularis TaxID=588596 RepID=A0A2N0PSI0_9GLOM|nr:hypothetical protein RhiirA5_398495 [Rhizophagus irregularis]